MKRLAVVLTVLTLLIFSVCCDADRKDVSSALNTSVPSSTATDLPGKEMRGVWISYSELQSAFDGDFRANMDKMLDNISALGLNTVFFHVRPFCDAFYRSDIFPWSKHITGTEGKAPSLDPLEYAVNAAHERGIDLHAWINPYRVSYSINDADRLSDGSPVKKYMAAHPNSGFAVPYGNGLYLNPASEDATQLIVDGVKEIIQNYDVDGIHFDDYFYPTTDASFDRADYTAYCAAKSKPMSLDDWRRDNVNRMLSRVHAAVKEHDEKMPFGVSPAGNMQLNYDELYADTEAWVENGCVDYLIPQLYFGYTFPNEKYKFENLIYDWSKYRKKVNVIAGLAAYKIGNAEGEEKAEWESGCVLEKQIKYARGYKFGGFVFFSYSSLFSEDETNTNERSRISNFIGE